MFAFSCDEFVELVLLVKGLDPSAELAWQPVLARTFVAATGPSGFIVLGSRRHRLNFVGAGTLLANLSLLQYAALSRGLVM